MTFLRELLAVILGVFIAGGIMFLVFLAFVSASASSFGEEAAVVVKNNSILELNLENAIVDDYSVTDPFASFLGSSDSDVLEMHEIINAIENAKTDDNIKGISINTLFVNAGISQTQTIRNKLLEFKESGKFIVAYADVFTQKNYYLSSVADSIYMNPVGAGEFKGLSSEILYFKDFEDKYGVKMEIIRHGKYKSAVEPFLSNEMSDANREQISSFLNSIWSEMVTDIGESRNKSDEEINKIADDLLLRTPSLALENSMIDAQLYFDQYEDKLKTLADLDSTDKLNTVTINDYISSGKGRIKSSATDKIAVLYAQGNIMYGDGDHSYIGQGKMTEALRKVTKDKRVKAIVLRVNSPGGSALASDLIWRELELAKKEKPLVVSMGNLAASGGYYIACNADSIVAEPTTITGSIGVFGMIPNINKFADNIGINAEQVGTNKQSVGYSLFEPMSEDFRNVTEEGVKDVYSTFVNRVAQGRGMTPEEVDNIAQGRVWTGTEAFENGLVDKLGSLEDAIKMAAELAEIETYRTTNYPRFKVDFQDTFSPFSISAKTKEKLLKEELGIDNYNMYKNMKGYLDLKGIQARMPFLLEIK